MRIGFCGNTNNYPFVVANALRELGHEVVFIVDSKHALYRPECKIPAARAGYGSWIHDVSPVRIRDLILPTPVNLRIRRLLAPCDAHVFNGYGLSLSAYFNKRYFVILTGGDLDVFANPDALDALGSAGSASARGAFARKLAAPALRRFVRMQRNGIANAQAVEYALPGMLPHGDEMLAQLGVANDRRHCFMATDLTTLPFTPLPSNAVLRLFCPARLNWVLPVPPGVSVLDYKGGDEMLRALARFRRTHGTPFELRLVKKGMHVEETRAYAEELGLSDVVTWLDEMTQHELYEEIHAADVVLDHFGEGSIGIAARDALAIGRPVIANAKPEIYERWLGEPIPVLQARNAAEIVGALAELASRSRREWYAAQGRAFAEKYFAPERAAREVIARLQP